ncbi:hypothetical protein M3J09_003418 [Ascochyta lentis]
MHRTAHWESSVEPPARLPPRPPRPPRPRPQPPGTHRDRAGATAPASHAQPEQAFGAIALAIAGAIASRPRLPVALTSAANLLPYYHPRPNETTTPHHPDRDPDDRDDRDPPYQTSLQLRQQHADDYYRAHHNHSRLSSSSGSAAHSLRRTPHLDHPQRGVRFSDSPRPASRPRLVDPHPALRISRRTASAIRFVLEEAIRAPYAFTPDPLEEKAAMSDLMATRPANGGARTTAGPTPVTHADRSNIRTPQMIMNERRQREAARRQQSEADELRKADDERRRSVERRAHAVAGVAATNPLSEPGQQRRAEPQHPPSRSGDQHVRYPSTGAPRQPDGMLPPSASTRPRQPDGMLPPSTSTRPQDAVSGAQQARSRANSQAQQQPRPAPAAPPSAGERRQPSGDRTHARRPSAATASAQPGPSTAPPPRPAPPPDASQTQLRDSTTSNFPHAFERWETLSSHWEGLTSYWIRRLEQNTDEVRREPLAQQMSRQITDLSAAGANLFHAVVELQRLRASSERKFQRWFYEHRQDQEKAQEREASFEATLNGEREARMAAEANMERMATEKKNAERAVSEMKRELQISKEEARRAWEELGRREQEERDRTFSLREGQPTLVGGVQVVPTAQGMGGPGRSPGESAYAGAQSSGDIEQHYSYEAQSPTDTDPFTEALHGHREQDIANLSQGAYIPSGAASSSEPTSSSQATAHPIAPGLLVQYPMPSQHGQQAPVQPATSHPEAFYQQPESYLHEGRPTNSMAEDSQSYVTSHADETSEGDEEYAIDSRGNYILDDAGHRVPFRSLQSPMSDEYDVSEDRRRELEHLQRYGSAANPPSQYATTGAEQGSPHGQGYATAQRPVPDYSGDGYGDEWIGMRHHHPTRLSDVPEEDERSRASPTSRASVTSRGRLF